jgi:hypothetical protein
VRVDSLMALVILTIGLAGCGSYWDLRQGEQLAIGCASPINYFLDEDGDSWGRPDSPPTPACGPDPDSQLTASNALDCDETDRLITGLSGAICPADLGGGSPTHSGFVLGQSEFVGTYADSPALDYRDARMQCLAWAGGPTPETPETAHYGLASLETANEYNTVVDWLAEQVGGPVSVWVDLVWSSTDPEAGAWQWPDGTEPTYVPACNDVEATPLDVYPDLVLGLEGDNRPFSERIGQIRLALVYDGTEWCRGVPNAKGGTYPETMGHLLCERQTPQLSDYEEQAEGAAE